MSATKVLVVVVGVAFLMAIASAEFDKEEIKKILGPSICKFNITEEHCEYVKTCLRDNCTDVEDRCDEHQMKNCKLTDSERKEINNCILKKIGIIRESGTCNFDVLRDEYEKNLNINTENQKDVMKDLLDSIDECDDPYDCKKALECATIETLRVCHPQCDWEKDQAKLIEYFKSGNVAGSENAAE